MNDEENRRASLLIVHSSLILLLLLRVRFAAAPVAAVTRMAVATLICVFNGARSIVFVLGTLLALVLTPRRFALCFVGQVVIQLVFLGFIGRIADGRLGCSFAHTTGVWYFFTAFFDFRFGCRFGLRARRPVHF